MSWDSGGGNGYARSLQNRRRRILPEHVGEEEDKSADGLGAYNKPAHPGTSEIDATRAAYQNRMQFGGVCRTERI